MFRFVREPASKHLLIISSMLLLLLAGCTNVFETPLEEPPEIVAAQPSLKTIEARIRGQYDPSARYTYAEYEELLACLDDEKFRVVSIQDMNAIEDPTKVIVGLRHDVDRHPFKAMEMSRMEEEHGFGASYYILSNAYYAGKYVDGQYTRYTAMGEVYRNIADMGMEIGIHNDLLTMQLARDIDPLEFNTETMEYYRSLGIEVTGNVAHGSPLMRELSLTNYYVFSDFAYLDPQNRQEITWNGKTYSLGARSMAEFGFQYEANFVNKNVYISDAGGKWKHTIAGITYQNTYTSEIVDVVRNSVPGDRIQILTHPVWWGR